MKTFTFEQTTPNTVPLIQCQNKANKSPSKRKKIPAPVNLTETFTHQNIKRERESRRKLRDRKVFHIHVDMRTVNNKHVVITVVDIDR